MERVVNLDAEMMWQGARFRFRTQRAVVGQWYISDVSISAEEAEYPQNDECSTAIEIFEGLTMADNSNSTTSGPLIDDACQLDELPADVWFYHEARCTGTMFVTTCDLSQFDAEIRVYKDSEFMDCGVTTPLEMAGCELIGDCESGLGSLVRFECIEGQRYLVQYGSSAGAYGSGFIYVDCEESDEETCLGDYNKDGIVDGQDLATLLASWGDGKADLDGDGEVAGTDLAIVLGAWGICR